MYLVVICSPLSLSFIRISIHCNINKGLVILFFPSIGNLRSTHSYYNLYIPATLNPQVYKVKETKVTCSWLGFVSLSQQRLCTGISYGVPEC